MISFYRKAALYCFFVFIISCGPQRYYICSNKTYQVAKVNGRLALTRCVLVPYFASELPLLNPERENLLYKTAEFIQKKQYENADILLNNSRNKVNMLLPLSKGINFLFQKNYSSALIHFEAYKGEEFKCLNLMLITDCRYELELQHKKYMDYNKFISQYQNAMDCTQDPELQSVITRRVKFLKYGQ